MPVIRMYEWARVAIINYWEKIEPSPHTVEASILVMKEQMDRIPDEVQMLIWNYIFPKHCWKHPVIDKFNRVLVSLPQLQAACLPSLSLGRDRVTFFYIAPKPQGCEESLLKRIVKVTRLLTDEEKGQRIANSLFSGLRGQERLLTPPPARARHFSKEHLSWI